MTTTADEDFSSLLKILNLSEIKLTLLHSEQKGSFLPNTKCDVTWNAALADGDPGFIDDSFVIFRPRYEFLVNVNEQCVFKHASIFLVVFQTSDKNEFDRLWGQVEINRRFVESQLRRTLWPFLRQQILDGMSRLGMPPLTLPWILP